MERVLSQQMHFLDYRARNGSHFSMRYEETIIAHVQ